MAVDESTITKQAIASFEATPDPRLAEIMVSLVSHLHGFIRETRPTPEEWLTAIRLLADAGQACTAERQEFILLSDILGKQPEFNLCGSFRTEKDGRFHFVTLLPKSYPIPTDGPVGAMLRAARRNIFRPAHIHFKISADGHHGLVTELHSRGDKFLDRDPVFGVKDSLVVDFEHTAGGLRLDRDFVLARIP